MEPNSEKNYITCKTCGAKLSPDAMVCEICGSEVVENKERYEEERIHMYEESIRQKDREPFDEPINEPVEEIVVENVQVDEEQVKKEQEIAYRNKELRNFCGGKLFLWLVILVTAAAVGYVFSGDIINIVGYIMMAIPLWKIWKEIPSNHCDFKPHLTSVSKAINVMYKITQVVLWIMLVCFALAIFAQDAVMDAIDAAFIEVNINGITEVEQIKDILEEAYILMCITGVVVSGVVLYLCRVFYLACMRFVNGIIYSIESGTKFTSKNGYGVAIYLLIVNGLSVLGLLSSDITLSGSWLSLICSLATVACNIYIAVVILIFKRDVSKD